MPKNRSVPLRGSVNQNNATVRMRPRPTGIGFLARLGIVAALLLVVAGGAAFLWRQGWPQRQAASAGQGLIGLTQKAQFAIHDIIVEGRHQADKTDIIDALGTQRGSAILDFDPHMAAARLAKLPWTAHVTVERRLPDTIAVLLTERAPLARWQHDDKIYVIDSNGGVLPTARPEDFSGLPLVVGSGADREAANFLVLLKSYPDIENKVTSAVRVGDRRWDIYLPPRLIVRLPEQNPGTGLHRLSVLIAQDKILDRDIVAVDLRMPDRVVIEPAAPVKAVKGRPL